VDFAIKNIELYALEQKDRMVYVFSLEGNLLKKIKLQKTDMSFPRSLAIDESGYIYILDRHAGEIVVFSSNGQFKYSFLEPGQARGQLYYPIEIKFDPWGRLCVVEEGNGRVQVFTHR
jgi:6-phosphogluconolactonase (cycloisomerase 2 family)